MSEWDMDRIAGVVDLRKIVAGPNAFAQGIENSRAFAFGITRQCRRFSLADIGKNQPQILLDRVALDLNIIRNSVVLSRNLHALSRSVVFPTVIETPDAVLFDPPGGKLGLTVGATKIDNVRLATFTAIQSEVLIYRSVVVLTAADVIVSR
jgi:hypothetical protein